MLYDGWLGKIAKRFQARIDKMQAHYNFDLGDEFELAIAEVLKESLPDRAGVCRGFVVDEYGNRAGDDVIVYDAARFPTLRALGKNLAQKEDVPAEAVLAYIEAKNTLKFDAPYSDGASLHRAAKQVEKVKLLRRPQVPLSVISEHANLGPGFTFSAAPGSPNFRNPWYCAIWGARGNLNPDPEQSTKDDTITELRPEVIATPDFFAAPLLVAGEQNLLMQFAVKGNDISISRISNGTGLGLAVVHLLWAIEFLLLPRIPWDRMLLEELNAAAQKGELAIAKVRQAKTDEEQVMPPARPETSAEQGGAPDGAPSLAGLGTAPRG